MVKWTVFSAQVQRFGCDGLKACRDCEQRATLEKSRDKWPRDFALSVDMRFLEGDTERLISLRFIRIAAPGADGTIAFGRLLFMLEQATEQSAENLMTTVRIQR
jgi:hypothetical protein